MAASEVFHGKFARVIWGGNTVANLTDWEVTATRDTIGATPMVVDCSDISARWNTFKAGNISWTATSAGYTIGSASDIGGMAQSDIGGNNADTPVTIKFYFECATAGSGYLEGSAYMTATNFAANSTSIETCGYGWTGTGALDYKVV